MTSAYPAACSRCAPSTAPGMNRIRSGSTLYGTSSMSVPSLSIKIAGMLIKFSRLAKSRPRRFSHREHHHLRNHRLFGLAQHIADRIRDIAGILQDVWIGVRKALEDKGGPHAAADDRRDLDVVLASFNVQSVTKPQQ